MILQGSRMKDLIQDGISPCVLARFDRVLIRLRCLTRTGVYLITVHSNVQFGFQSSFPHIAVLSVYFKYVQRAL